LELESIDDNLDIDQEYSKCIQFLKTTNRKFHILKQPLSFESFKHVLLQNPKVVHMSCHGDFDYESKQFYLQFEEYGTGMVDKFN